MNMRRRVEGRVAVRDRTACPGPGTTELPIPEVYAEWNELSYPDLCTVLVAESGRPWCGFQLSDRKAESSVNKKP